MTLNDSSVICTGDCTIEYLTIDDTGVIDNVTDDGTNLTITGTGLPTDLSKFSVLLGG